jgi:hypothetical protein
MRCPGHHQERCHQRRRRRAEVATASTESHRATGHFGTQTHRPSRGLDLPRHQHRGTAAVDPKLRGRTPGTPRNRSRHCSHRGRDTPWTLSPPGVPRCLDRRRRHRRPRAEPRRRACPRRLTAAPPCFLPHPALLRDLGEPPFQAPTLPSKCSIKCMYPS